MDNAHIAEAFDELADLVELAGESAHKARALRGFAATVRGLGEPVVVLDARGELEALPGVGKGVASKVRELVASGAMIELDRLRKAIPGTLLDVLRVPGLGPRKARALWQGLGITSLGELAYACKENRLVELPGFGARTQERVLAAVTFIIDGEGRVVLGKALELGGYVAAALREGGADAAVIAGEARRGLEVVTEIVVVAGGLDLLEARDALAASPYIREVTPLAREGFRVAVGPKLWVRVRTCPKEEMVASLLVETGDAAHLRWLNERARERGEDLLALARRSTSEAALYRALDVPPIPPELREGASPEVPAHLIVPEDISGFFHAHTDWSDGNATIVAMARGAAQSGYRFVGISDHSKAAAYARGLDEKRLAEQRDAIASARREVPEIVILHGCEVDILADGRLDIDDEALARLDFVVASVHSRMSQDEATMTARLVRAVSHPLVTMLGHPTGRLLLARRGYAFDLRAVAEAAAKNDTLLEINANANRLDLSDKLLRRVASTGAHFVVNPDAHDVAGIADEPLGVRVARRAGLPNFRVKNAAPVTEVLAWLRARQAKGREALGFSREGA